MWTASADARLVLFRQLEAHDQAVDGMKRGLETSEVRVTGAARFFGCGFGACLLLLLEKVGADVATTVLVCARRDARYRRAVFAAFDCSRQGFACPVGRAQSQGDDFAEGGDVKKWNGNIRESLRK